MSRARRRVVIALLVVVLVGVSALDHAIGSPAAATPAPAPTGAIAVSSVGAAGVATDAWYCLAGGGATIVLTSSSTHTVRGTVHFDSGTAADGAAALSVTVPPGGQVRLPGRVAPPSVTAPTSAAAAPAHHAPPPPVRAEAATVVLDGGGVGASVDLQTAAGWTAAPCASEMSSTWYFPQGSSVIAATLRLDLYDPGATPAVVDVGLVTPAGEEYPPSDQGVTVAPGGVLTTRLSLLDASQPLLGATVLATHGTVVAAEFASQRSDLTTGSSEELGAPTVARQWLFSQSIDLPRSAVTFDVLNPTPTAQEVSATFSWPGGAAQPVAVTVPADSVVPLVAAHELRVLRGAVYQTVVTTSGPGIVVGRTVAATGNRSSAIGACLGVPGGARTWLVPAVTAPGIGAWTFAISARSPARVSVWALGGSSPTALAGLHDRAVWPSAPLVFGPGAGVLSGVLSGVGPVLVTSSAPVAVELDALPAGYPGAVVAPALPLLG